MANKDLVLNFGEFKRERNSFGLHFVGEAGKHMFGDVYRAQTAYKRCAGAHPEFVKMVVELQGQQNFESPEYLKKLYEAYKLMHPYAETNDELFT